MAFRGFPEAAVLFYEGLEADNSRDYWQAHKSTYEDAVRAPMEALLADLEDEFGEGKIFRPYRDVRFSKDKSPYKTAIGATLDSGGYIQFSADGLGVGTGYYDMASDQLQRFRRKIDDDRTGREIAELTAKLRKAGMDISAHGELKTAPRGYPKDHERIELLRLKGLIAWRSWPPAKWQATTAAKKRVVDFLHAARPLMDWLDENVGRTELPPDPRHRHRG